MRALPFLLVVGTCLAFAFACGGGGGSTTPPTTSGTGAAGGSGPVAVAPLQLVADKDGSVALEMRADGSIVTAKGEVLATFDGRKLVGAETGKGILIADDGTIHPASGQVEDDMHLGFDDHGDIVSSKGDKIAVSDDGVPTISESGKPSKPIPAHIKGMTPQTHRAAVLLLFVALMAHDKPQMTVTSATASPVPPPPPPPPPPAPIK